MTQMKGGKSEKYDNDDNWDHNWSNNDSDNINSNWPYELCGRIRKPAACSYRGYAL